jgi:hypothetical protein
MFDGSEEAGEVRGDTKVDSSVGRSRMTWEERLVGDQPLIWDSTAPGDSRAISMQSEMSTILEIGAAADGHWKQGRSRRGQGRGRRRMVRALDSLEEANQE